MFARDAEGGGRHIARAVLASHVTAKLPAERDALQEKHERKKDIPSDPRLEREQPQYRNAQVGLGTCLL
jgi:hypothetical protein